MRMVDLLPGFNCGRCGFASCRAFANGLKVGKSLEDCPLLKQERYRSNLEQLQKMTMEPADALPGLVGGLQGEVLLGPLPKEPSCREDIYPFDRDVRARPGELITYRPLGCPIVHFGKVLEVNHSILTIHLTGPLNRLGEDDYHPLDLGICQIAAFEGVVQNEHIVEVGETVRFIPHQCMMQKVHTGVVVRSEGDQVRIEAIDLKVWS